MRVIMRTRRAMRHNGWAGLSTFLQTRTQTLTQSQAHVKHDAVPCNVHAHDKPHCKHVDDTRMAGKTW